jgi:hypothetical protein
MFSTSEYLFVFAFICLLCSTPFPKYSRSDNSFWLVAGTNPLSEMTIKEKQREYFLYRVLEVKIKILKKKIVGPASCMLGHVLRPSATHLRPSCQVQCILSR